MKLWIKASIMGWVGFKICESLLGPLTKRIWAGLERTSIRFGRQMGLGAA